MQGEAPPAKKAKTDSGAAPTGSTSTAEDIRKVFVGNLSFQIDDDTVREVFKDVGEIVQLDWFTHSDTGKFRGCGTLEFGTSAEALKACDLNGTVVLDRAMKVEIQKSGGARGDRDRGDRGGKRGARGDRGGRGGRGDRNGGGARQPTPKPEGCDTVFLGNLSFQVTEDAVRDLFSTCGDIQDIRWVEKDGAFKGVAFMQFGDSDATDKAVALAGSDLLGRAVRVDYAETRSKKSF